MGIEHMDFAAARRAMVDSQLRPQAVTDPAVIAAMATVARERFVPKSALGFAYMDRALPLGNGRAMTPPATLGRMLVELAVQAGERGLLVGAGTGYSAALLSEMGAVVTALESDSALADTFEGLADDDVQLVRGELAAGAGEAATFDFILIDGAVETLPDPLIDKLKPGGRLCGCLLEGGVQRLVVGRRTGTAFGVKSLADAAAPLLPGFARPRAFTF
jgi:protein-L-isoaspartate(D-aspartate) O-methyltransferase